MTAHPARRRIHAALAVAVLAALGSRSEARDPVLVDAEVAAYGGTTSANLPPYTSVCGVFPPHVGTTLGGVGARVRLRYRTDANRPTNGFAATVHGAVEHRANELLRPGSGGERNVPPDQLMGGGAVAVGYEGRLFGLQLGVGAREVYGRAVYPCGSSSCYRDAMYPSTYVAFYPQMMSRIGPAVGPHGEVGFGAYTAVATLRPGFYAGFGYEWPGGQELAVRLVSQSSTSSLFDLNLDARFDLSGAVPVGERVRVGLGAAVINGAERIDYEGRATVAVRFGR